MYNSKNLSDKINKQNIIYPHNRLISKFSKFATVFMPLIFESFDLRDYDIIISDGTAWPKGVLTRSNQLHISYVHTPPRFLYKYSVETTKRSKWYFKPAVAIIDSVLRVWDYSAAQRPDYLVTNSHETQNRIKKFYNRESHVIYPPVDIKVKVPETPKDNTKAPFYLSLGRLAAYKNNELLVQAFNLNGLPLIIAGTGSEEAKLRKMAKGNITFTGRVTEVEKAKLLNDCIGLIFPVKEEDFGITAIEAMAYGKPVLTHRSGGVLETVREGIDGMFFDQVELSDFTNKMKLFDEAVRKGTFKSEIIKEHVQSFDEERFKNEFMNFVEAKFKEKNA
jgi:glycosyltransferase involved in cell wall biosynthesis